ncbi:MAG TPA: hypothetical protein VK503_11030 [Candidatus Bathyarchaeia archaeon]|nr:hypothetical protein [Candidatus Bathyarchaeia archaeon]
MNKLGLGLGIILLVAALGTAPMPLVTTFSNPTRSVTIYPNLLFAVPLLLLSTLLILYGLSAEKT